MSSTLKVLSYNIHKGFAIGNKRYVLEHIREALRTIEVDIVFLQEVTGRHIVHHEDAEEQITTSQLEFLAHEVWPHHIYGRNAVYTSGHHGNAILSKFPIVQYENIDISTNWRERRGLLHAVIDCPYYPEPIHCMNVHLDLLHRGRVKQIQSLCARIKETVSDRLPLLIAGDFNDWSKRLSALLERDVNVYEAHKKKLGSYVATFPSKFPVLPLDRIYIREFSPKHCAAFRGAPWDSLSDHIPVFAELLFKHSTE